MAAESPYTVLVVDDRPINREYLSTLIRCAGYRVLEASDGRDALYAAQQHKPDLIITDILMPTMDGYELVHRLRAEATLAATPVIFYTATFRASEARLLAQACGVNVVLAKPSEPREILRAIAGLLHPGSAPAQIAEIQVHRNGLRTRTQRPPAPDADLSRITGRLSTLIELSLDMAAERDTGKMLELMFGAACRVLPADYSALGVLQPTLDAARQGLARGCSIEWFTSGAEPAGGFLQRVLKERLCLRLDAQGAALPAAELPPDHPPVGALLALPLASRNDCYGWLYFARRPGAQPFTDEDEQIATTLSASGGTLYENASFYDLVQRHAAELKVEVTRRKRSEDTVRRLAFTDLRTGLHNRTALLSKLGEAVDEAQKGKRAVGLLLLTIANFREVNDTLGYTGGDELLQQLAGRLREALFDADVVARVGSAQFGILLARLGQPRDAEAVARKLLETLAPHFPIGDIPIEAQVHIGAAVFPQDAGNAEELLRCAGVAAHTARTQRQGFCPYHARLEAFDAQRLALIHELREAIANNQLILHYQPKLSLRSLRVESVEALVRWQHPTRGLVQPDLFVPAAERTGLIDPLTFWVLDAALEQAARWHVGGAHLDVAVNVSPNNLRQSGFNATVLKALRASRMPGRHLILELTENALMEEPDLVTRCLEELGTHGIRVSLDDFGIGQSSLARLQQLPIYELKLDKSFVIALDDPRCAGIARATVRLARELDLKVTAEGAETEQSLRLLRHMGCDCVQGYYVGKPMPGAELPGWVAARGWEIGRGPDKESSPSSA